MKKITYVCERCGKEITGQILNIYVGCIDRESGDFLDSDDTAEWEKLVQDKYFCQDCMKKIVKCENNTGDCNTGNCNTGRWNTGNCNTGNCNTGRCNTGNCNTGRWNTGNCNTGDRNTGDRNTGIRNTGNRNTGNRNTGDRNTGNCNTGNRNTGDWNTGDRNTGNCNTGDWNTGDWNTGDRNAGDWNTGDWNTGDRNTGDWNKSSFNTGCFMTEEQKIMLFDKPSDWTYRDWLNSDARHLLGKIPRNVVEWIQSDDMTDEEKEDHPTHETVGGYLKVLDESESGQLWWNNLSFDEKNIIMGIQNFDKEKFKKITGIDVDG